MDPTSSPTKQNFKNAAQDLCISQTSLHKFQKSHTTFVCVTVYVRIYTYMYIYTNTAICKYNNSHRRTYRHDTNFLQIRGPEKDPNSWALIVKTPTTGIPNLLEQPNNPCIESYVHLQYGPSIHNIDCSSYKPFSGNHPNMNHTQKGPQTVGLLLSKKDDLPHINPKGTPNPFEGSPSQRNSSYNHISSKPAVYQPQTPLKEPYNYL